MTVSMPPPVPGHADKLNPDADRVLESIRQQAAGPSAEDLDRNGGSLSQAEMLAQVNLEDRCDLPFEANANGEGHDHTTTSGVSRGRFAPEIGLSDGPLEDFVDRWQPKPPKVLMENADDTPLELRSQIQLYATTE
jgi:hypothetical protein